jgi:anti-sigma factor RsiW
LKAEVEMMNKTDSPVCERSSDLMAFIYKEMDASESREFETHLRVCGNCREEAASFGVVRESIVAWRDEVLTGFVPSTATPARRSAAAAFRQFFDLSPLWLKGAAAFAMLTFFVLAGLLYVNFRKEPATAAGAVYTKQDVDRLVKEAVAEQQQKNTPVTNTSATTVATLQPAASQPKKAIKQPTASRNRRPLSRAEREQLAADLRLLPTDDDLDLISDRINQ